jgi:hypothetical protein
MAVETGPGVTTAPAPTRKENTKIAKREVVGSIGRYPAPIIMPGISR